VAVVQREGRADVDEALARVARMYEGNFEFLGLARGLVDAAMRERDLAENDGASGGAQGGGRRGEGLSRRAYREAIERMRKLVAEKVPAGSTVAVISRGDEELLHLGGRRAWHFPRTEQGVYAGYHPADSAAAVAHLKALREQGADVLMVPVTAFWWLRHYAEFARYLDENCELLARQEDACALYALGRVDEQPRPAPGPVERVVGRLRHLFGTRRDGTK
jgi:hypothetical protein